VREVLQRPDVLERAGVNVPRVTSLGKALKEKNLYQGELPQDLGQAELMMKEALHAVF
jgi:hypothetical protein